MEGKAYAIIVISFIVGFMGGYLAGLWTFQNQVLGLQLQITELEETISDLEATIEDLQQGGSQQAQTQVRTDTITWDITNDNCSIVVRNTGSVAATVESIAIRLSASGSTFYAVQYTTGNSINTGSTTAFEWTETSASAPTDFLKTLTEYVVRITATTGFQYEMVATSPSN